MTWRGALAWTGLHLDACMLAAEHDEELRVLPQSLEPMDGIKAYLIASSEKALYLALPTKTGGYKLERMLVA